MISRVSDLLQSQSGRWHHCDGGIANPSLSDRSQPLMITLTSGYGDQCPEEGPHHRVAERISAYGALDDTGHGTGWDAPTSQLEESPDRASPVPPTAEGAEVPQTEQAHCLLVQPSKIDFGRQLGNLIAVERIRRYASV